MALSLTDAIKLTSALVQAVYKVAVVIYDSEELYIELREAVKCITTDLVVIEGILDNLQHFARRVSSRDEKFIYKNIEILRKVITDAQNLLEEIQRDRNFLQRLFMKNAEYKRQLRDISRLLNNSCSIIQGALPTIHIIQVERRQFPDFRRLFQNHPEKLFSVFDGSFIKTPTNSSSLITFNSNRDACFLKLDQEKFYFSYQLRTWSSLIPTQTILAKRRDEFNVIFRNQHQLKSPEKHIGFISLAGPAQPSAPLPPSLQNPCERLDFSEMFISHNHVCGIAVTQTIIYIATKYEITSVSLGRQKVIAQFGGEGQGPNRFNHICFLYIPPDDQTSLYIVDRGHFAVHQYQINETGLRFRHRQDYCVIANVNQQYNLISCTIHNQNLYVSDNANNCLHIFPLKGQRQSAYLTDNLLTPFSPGFLCTHGKYLYVTYCSSADAGILVFNEECQPIDWFRNHALENILAMDIDIRINELYIVTTTAIEDINNIQQKRPLIVSMESTIRT